MYSIVFHVLNFTYSREEDTTEKASQDFKLLKFRFLNWVVSVWAFISLSVFKLHMHLHLVFYMYDDF